MPGFRMSGARRVVLASLSCLVLATATPERLPAQPFVEPTIEGYGYLTHEEGPDLWTVGNVFTILTIADGGDVTLIPMDEVANQYTVVLENLRVASVDVHSTYSIVRFETGMIYSAYEDSWTTGTTADFGTTSPPNTTAPASFADGALLGSGVTQSEDIWLEVSPHDANQEHFQWAGPLPLTNCALLGPAFSGPFKILGHLITAEPDATLDPELPAPGYAFRFFAEGNCDSPLQTPASTWGRVKSMYR